MVWRYAGGQLTYRYYILYYILAGQGGGGLLPGIPGLDMSPWAYIYPGQHIYWTSGFHILLFQIHTSEAEYILFTDRVSLKFLIVL